MATLTNGRVTSKYITAVVGKSHSIDFPRLALWAHLDIRLAILSRWDLSSGLEITKEKNN